MVSIPTFRKFQGLIFIIFSLSELVIKMKNFYLSKSSTSLVPIVFENIVSSVILIRCNNISNIDDTIQYLAQKHDDFSIFDQD